MNASRINARRLLELITAVNQGTNPSMSLGDIMSKAEIDQNTIDSTLMAIRKQTMKKPLC